MPEIVSDERNDNTSPFKRYVCISVVHGRLKSMQNKNIAKSDIKGEGEEENYV